MNGSRGKREKVTSVVRQRNRVPVRLGDAEGEPKRVLTGQQPLDVY